MKASNTMNAAFFSRVALSADGNRMVVGADEESSDAVGVGGDQRNATAPGSGAAYVFSRSGPAWHQDGYIKASNTGVSDQFGLGVTLSTDGSLLAIGAPGEASRRTCHDIDGHNDDLTHSARCTCSRTARTAGRSNTS